MGVMSDFYQNLYSSNKVSDNCIDKYLSSIKLDNVLSDNDASFCEQFPSSHEFKI